MSVFIPEKRFIVESRYHFTCGPWWVAKRFGVLFRLPIRTLHRFERGSGRHQVGVSFWS